MKIWTASAVIRYYLDPSIAFLNKQGRSGQDGAGYYIVPHCDPGCCQEFGGIATVDLGPFTTRVKARNWSRRYMAARG